METKIKFEQLKEQELAATTNKERKRIHEELDKLAKEDPNGFEQAFIDSARSTLVRAQNLRIKEQLNDISEIVSMSYIAKTYFNKTKGWLSQRINELNVNGKPARFTADEIEILNAALRDISQKIGLVQVTKH